MKISLLITEETAFHWYKYLDSRKINKISTICTRKIISFTDSISQSKSLYIDTHIGNNVTMIEIYRRMR